MKCPNCHFENREGANFCNECGYKFELTCPECGATNAVGSKFCDGCGSKLSLPIEQAPKDLSVDEKLAKIQKYLPKGLTEKILSQRDRIEGERKQVTVMFCDMVGFTPLSELLGIEETYSIMDQVYEILIHKVHDYEGTVNEMIGDGIMALFGAPVALEDAPQRAIRSSLAIHREMAKFSEKLKQGKKGIPSLKMRIGIHTGPVVVGTLGNDLRVEFKAVGDTVNLASRMEGFAEPGTTYVSGETFKLTEGLFRVEALGEREVKGKKEPVNVYRVIAPSTRRTRFDVSAERGLTPVVGRERELELLLDGFERSKTGWGQAFSIMAEAGIGKSRLLYEFRKAVAHEDAIFLEGKCLSYSRGVAYHPVIDVLRANFDIQEEDGDSTIREKVKKGLQILAADEAATLPYLLELLSVKDSGIDDTPMSPEAKKARILDALKQIVLKGSQIRPLIMAIEDLHWIDKSSEESLQYLLGNISGAKVLLIFTYRPEFVHTWGGRSYHSQVNLNRLSNRESLSMVTHLLGTQDIEGALEELILKKTEGIPFYIEEFIKSFKDLQVIEKKDDTYRIAKEIQTVSIPAKVQDVIMARVDALSEETKSLIQAGSVVGREFSHDLIERVADLPDQKLLSHLSALKDSELIYERGIYPGSTYIFKHALTQEGVYQSLLKRTRQKYHRNIAQVLEEHFPGMTETHPELLGHHFTEAGLLEHAIPYWKKAGEIAIRRSANIEAVDHLTTALKLLKSLPDTTARDEQELLLHVTLCPAWLAVKGYATAEVGQTYARAYELCQRLGEPPQLVPVLIGLWLFHLLRLELHTAHELGKRLLSSAQRTRDPVTLLSAHYALGNTLSFLEELPAALEHLEQGIAIYDPQTHCSLAFRYGEDPGVACCIFRAWCLWYLGYPEQARQRMHETVTLAQRLSHPHSLAFALCAAAVVHQLRQERHTVQEQAEAAITLSREQGFPFFLALGKILRGWALAEREQAEERITQMRQGLAAYRAIGTRWIQPYFLALLAEAYGNAEQVHEGLHVMTEALDVIGTTREFAWEAELYRIKGELLLNAKGERRNTGWTPEDCFKKALDVARGQQAKSWELRAAMSLSRLWQLQGKFDDARKLLAPVYGWFTEGFETADLKKAKVLLDELSCCSCYLVSV